MVVVLYVPTGPRSALPPLPGLWVEAVGAAVMYHSVEGGGGAPGVHLQTNLFVQMRCKGTDGAGEEGEFGADAFLENPRFL